MPRVARFIVVIFLGLAILGFVMPLYRDLRKRGTKVFAGFGRPTIRPSQLIHVLIIGVVLFAMTSVPEWNESSRIVPSILGPIALVLTALSLAVDMMQRRTRPSGGPEDPVDDDDAIHMDRELDTAHLSQRVVLQRALIFFGWLVGLMISMAAIGLIRRTALRRPVHEAGGQERWTLVLPQAIGITAFVYFVFDRVMHIPWPPTLLGYLMPALKIIPSV